MLLLIACRADMTTPSEKVVTASIEEDRTVRMSSTASTWTTSTTASGRSGAMIRLSAAASSASTAKAVVRTHMRRSTLRSRKSEVETNLRGFIRAQPVEDQGSGQVPRNPR